MRPHNFTAFQHKHNQPCCSEDSLPIYTFQQPHNKSTSHPTVHVSSTTDRPFVTNTNTDDVMKWTDITHRHRLSHTVNGVPIALFKAGIVTDYYRWLLFILLVLYILPLPPRQPYQSDVSGIPYFYPAIQPAKTSSSHCVVMYYPLNNQILLSPSCTFHPLS